MVAYNDIRDVVGIENLLHAATVGVSRLLPNINPVDAIACLRDLGLFSLAGDGRDPNLRILLP